MLDGRIDTQGTISELRQRGLLKKITADSKKEKAREASGPTEEKPQDGKGDDKKVDGKDKKKAKKLVEEEEIAEGRVKFSVYHSYVKASYVHHLARLGCLVLFQWVTN
jgi:carbamoylphosphate synthase small subunit